MKKLTKSVLWSHAVNGASSGHRYMLVCSDDFNYDYYIVCIGRNAVTEDVKAKIKALDGRNMQRVLEVYDLQDAKLRDKIMGKSRVWQAPK